MLTNRELIENALKRVNARLGVNGRLYNDHTLWFVLWDVMYLSQDAMGTDEMLAYLHGIEDCFNFLNIKREG